MKVYFLFAVVFSLLGSGCGSETGVIEKTNDSVYVAGVLEERKAKDNEFASSPKSPFASLTEDFTGLKYYAPDAKWVLDVNMVVADTVFVREIPDSKGGIRRYVYAGDFGFQIQGRNMHLQVFHEEGDSSGMLFIMFRDRTNGKETYGGGRYIEMAAPAKGGRLKLDFNRAFNPYCHYNHDYSCPVIPRDCYLDVEIEAGEKRYRPE